MSHLLALSEGATVAIAVAVISAAGSTAAVMAAGLAKRIEGRLGTPNGHGDVSTMLSTLIHQQAQLLDGQTGQDTRLAVIESRLGKGDERMAGLGGRLSDMADQVDDLAGKLAPLIDGQAELAERVGRIESSCQFIAHHVEETTDGV